VIFADFPDPDVIRVGDTYYMISTTMVNFPGATIVKSKDLVNWEYLTLCSPKRV
jgi:beta-xylosidase